MTDKKILVIDDSLTVREEVGRCLSSAGFKVLVASDGKEGIAVIDEHADLRLVVCDVNMPRMSGIEMLKHFSPMKRFEELPVIMLTTEGDPETIREAQRYGAKAWIIKPFEERLLVQAVRALAAA